MKERKVLSYDVIEDYGIVEEHPSMNKAITLRKASWGNRAGKIEIREVDVAKDTVYKGIGFYSEEGLSNLCEVLIKNGFVKKSKLKELIAEMPDDELEIIEVEEVKKNFITEEEMLELQ
ncbi:MAG: hypothetical protein ACRC5T_11445 [Cetobacterium sp.]